MIDAILGIDVSKNTLDVSISRCTKVRTKSFANSSDGWHHLLDWLTTQKIQRVHACRSTFDPKPPSTRQSRHIRHAAADGRQKMEPLITTRPADHRDPPAEEFYFGRPIRQSRGWR